MAVLPLRGAKDAPRISLPVSTGRLCLRDFAMTDFEAVHAWSSREEVTRYLIWGPNSKAQTREALRDFRRDQRRRPRICWELAITLRQTGELIGGVGLRLHNWEERTGELGYVLHPDYWGCGYAREASEAMLHEGFAALGLHRIIATCDQRNMASARLMERLGMRREGAFRASRYIQGEWRDEYLYAILAEEFAG